MRPLFFGLVAYAIAGLGLSNAGADESPLTRPRETSVELSAGTSPSGGGGVAAALVREIVPWLAATGNAEWGQRPVSTGGPFPDVDRRLAYVGAGARLRLFPHSVLGNYLTTGLGLGRLSHPGANAPADWQVLPWTGIGVEVRVHGRVHVGAEFRVAWIRLDGSAEGDGGLPLRINVRIPVGKSRPSGDGGE